MDAQKLKEKFLASQEKQVVQAIDWSTPHYSALIDEAIESIIDGTTTINDKKVSTEEEALFALEHGTSERVNVFQGLIAGAKELKRDNVTISYRGITLKVK